MLKENEALFTSICDRERMKPITKYNRWARSRADTPFYDKSSETATPFSHFKINGDWYFFYYGFKQTVLSLIVVQDALLLHGSIDLPSAERIKTKTELFACLQKWGVSQRDMEMMFGHDVVKRMQGRVLRKLVNK